MSNGCTIVRVDENGFVPYPFGPDTGMITEERAKSIARTLAYDLPGTEIAVLEGDELLETYLVDNDYIAYDPDYTEAGLVLFADLITGKPHG